MPRQRREIPWLKVRHGFYYVYWYDDSAGRTKRLSLGTENAVEAQQRFSAFLAGGHTSYGPAAARGLTVAGALKDYEHEHVAKNVVDKDRFKAAASHLKAWFTDTLLKDIGIAECEAYAEVRRMGVIGGGKRRKATEGSDGTIRRELVVLRAAARHALRRKRITEAEMPVFELPAETPRQEETAWLTRDELNSVLAAAESDLLDFIVIAYYTAARRASVERLTRFQVDLPNSRINLTSPHETANQRRSVKRRPIVPIDPAMRPTVERLMTANSGSEWLFGCPRSMYKPFVALLTKLGLGDKAFPHILRHSRATHLLQSGVEIYAVARLLGDTVATVERTYGHASAEYLAEAIRRRS